ncbi:hypothetical protein CBR_g3177 [Chara braunii]|uniref:3-oxoacyl-[acyl-carrier-protein] synthase I, chloroplastic n=1 Tax=Chara braunii TaxID=69332 RepID=A0A388KF55_CHABU|nr:hypothetical protein CBR_g3177 [Chara braunii]|eukprot:GBG68636.1 hypothetical protein CBR_g3177 [Chara braunii]
MSFAAAAPLCGWFLAAACVSSTIDWGVGGGDGRRGPRRRRVSEGAHRSTAPCLRGECARVRRRISRERTHRSDEGEGVMEGSSMALMMPGGGVQGAARGICAGYVAATTASASSRGAQRSQQDASTTRVCLSSGSGFPAAGGKSGAVMSSAAARRSSPLTAAQRRTAVKRSCRARPPARATAIAVQQLEDGRETVSPGDVETTKSPQVTSRRVVVTGLGVVTSLGLDPTTFYNNLLEGRSGVSEIETFDCKDCTTRIAAEIKSFCGDGYIAPKMAKRMDRYIRYVLVAGKKALEDGGLVGSVLEKVDKTRCGVLIGSAMGGLQVFNDAIEALRISYRKMNPFCIPFATTNMGSALLAMDLGFMGPNYSISSACATGNYCILSAANHIWNGDADLMLAGGSDAAVLPIGLGGFMACRALSTRNDDPAGASRPWDVDRDGFVMGEGAGVLVLEELEHAKARGAAIYAEFLGGSFTCDAHHMTEPHPDGAGVSLCIDRALETSGVRKEDVNYVNAHATSTHAGDMQEYQALIRAFGQNAELKMNATKSMIGHLLGAAGAVEAVATVQAIRTGLLHPTINLRKPEPSLDTDLIVMEKPARMDIKVALSNSFGFGGHNSCILLGPYKPS